MDARAARLRAAYPDANADTGAKVVPLHEHLTSGSAATSWILLGVMMLVALAASYRPARTASRIDPLLVLKSD